MTTDDMIEEQPSEEPEEVGPGELLSRKRETLGLGIRQVAEDLHITMHYVKALESNAFDKLPGDVFVRGYIRAYANLVHLDPQVILNVYGDYTNQRHSTEEHAYQALARRRSDRNLPWVLISGVAFVVIAVVLWFFGAGGSDDTAATAVQRNSPTANGNGTAATLENVGTRLASDPVTVTRSAESGVEPEAQSADEPVPDLSAEPVAGPESAMPAATDPEDAGSPSATADPTAAAPASVEAERVINIDAGGSDVVQMVFKGNSSVQVDDSTDKQIYRDTRDAGDVLRISGSAPFDISLGDAGSVELSLNGAPVDFSSSIRIDNSARLTIGL